MTWLDDGLPSWHFAETHHRDSVAGPEALLNAAQAWRPEADRLIGAAMAVREAPARLASALGWRSGLADRPRFGKDDFVLLGREGDRALAYGLAGRFWQPAYGLRRLPDGAAWRAFSAAGEAKLLLGFEVHALPDPPCVSAPVAPRWRLTTVTRIHCPDPAARRRLGLYWLAIRPVSGIIRQRMLAQVCALAEAGVSQSSQAAPSEPAGR